jgi:hypothetical protein
MMVVKYDTDGTLLFDTQWSEETAQFGSSLIVYDENIYITGGIGGGIFETDQLSFSLVKCDINGNTLWSRQWEEGEYRNWGYDLDAYGNHVYVTGRHCPKVSYVSDVVLLKYTVDGELVWSKLWADPYIGSHEYGRSIQVVNEYIYLSGGTLPQPFDFLLLKCDLEGEPGNMNPNIPSIPSGPTRGKAGEEIAYSTSATDGDDEQVRFLFDWGEGNTTLSEWVASGATASVSHVWAASGEYEIRVKARDEKGGESEWSEPLSVTMPKAKPVTTPLILERLCEHFLLLARLLHQEI